MRRFIVSAGMAVVIALASSGVTVASSDVAITVPVTTLVAKGAAVDVTFEVVCASYQDSATFNVEYGSILINQAAGKKVIVHADAEFYGETLTCDGSTVNSIGMRLLAQSMPFRKGDAIVGIHLYLAEYMYWTSRSGDASVVVPLR